MLELGNLPLGDGRGSRSMTQSVPRLKPSLRLKGTPAVEPQTEVSRDQRVGKRARVGFVASGRIYGSSRRIADAQSPGSRSICSTPPARDAT